MRSQIPVIVLALASFLVPAYAAAQDAPASSTPTPKPAVGSTPKAKATSTPTKAEKPAPKAKAAPPGKPGTMAPAKKKAIGNKVKKSVKKSAAVRVPPRMRSSSVAGPIGLDKTWSADTGPQGTFRMRLSFSWFDAANFPTQGASNLFLGTDLALAYTPHELVEAFLSFRGTSNTNEGGRPELIHTQGDLTLGAKVGTALTPMYSMAGALSVRMLSGLGGAGIAGDATSIDLRWLNTLDFKKTGEAPVRVHIDTGYYFENSESVYAGQEGEPSIIEEFGLQIARYDRLTVGLGLEFPIQEDIDPYIEYVLTLPILVELARRGEGSGDYGFNSVPHTITAGLRSFPLPELAIDLAIRYGLSNAPYTGVPATPPWTIVAGVSYTLDPRPEIIERVVKDKTAPPPPPASLGQVKGRVVAAGGKKPIAGAKVSYPGRSASSAQVTDIQGRFGGYQFKAGKVVVQASAKGYLTAKATAEVKKDKDAQVVFELKPDPAAQDGRFEVRVFDDRGRPIKARVALGGTASGTAGDATPKAPFAATVKAGRYPLIVSAKGFPDVKRPIQIKGADKTAIRITMNRPGKTRPISAERRPISAGRRGGGGGVSRGKYAVVSSRGISLKKKISFQRGTARLTADGRLVLADVAKGLKRVKTIKRVRIAAHASTKGSRAANMKLSNERARVVKKYLSGAGIAASRLQARGYGAEKPIGPNITARGRARNNRVNLVVLGR